MSFADYAPPRPRAAPYAPSTNPNSPGNVPLANAENPPLNPTGVPEDHPNINSTWQDGGITTSANYAPGYSPPAPPSKPSGGSFLDTDVGYQQAVGAEQLGYSQLDSAQK